MIAFEAKRSSENCVAGEAFIIPLAGLVRNLATLYFENQDLKLTLVTHGSPLDNSHPEYMGRIQVTSNSIELLNVNVSDVGNYTLCDHLNRKVKIIFMKLVGEFLLAMLIMLTIHFFKYAKSICW